MKENLSQISKALSSKDDRTINAFLKEILTPDEIKTISLRWELMKLLKNGVSQRDIAKKLGISLCKITRGSKILKDQKSTIRKIILNEHWQS